MQLIVTGHLSDHVTASLLICRLIQDLYVMYNADVRLSAHGICSEGKAKGLDYVQARKHQTWAARLQSGA